MNYNHSQFVFAREYRGMNQTALSQSIKGLSQSNLSKFEKGFDTLSTKLIEEVIKKLDFPRSFFEKRINNSLLTAHYRKRSGLTKAIKTKLNTSNRLIAYLIDELSDSVEFPEFKFKALHPEEYTPEYIAQYTRKLLKLQPDEPVKKIFHLMEKNGITVVELDEKEMKFDGVSLPSDEGNAVVIINKNFPNDRKRFTLAHELGHVIMHSMGDFSDVAYRDHKVKEDEANRFASEFLMPEAAIKNQLLNLKLSDLTHLKKYWLTSKASIIRRAKDLGCISPNKATNFMIELSRNGERKVEQTLVDIDKSTVFQQAYDLHKEHLYYSDSELSEAFALPSDVIERFCCFTEKPKLRIVI